MTMEPLASGVVSSSIYNEYGQVKDVEIAHTVANAEKPVREAQAKLDALTANIEVQGGLPLTEQQKKNIDFLTGLAEKFPTAFLEVPSNKGRIYKVLYPTPRDTAGSSWLVIGGQDGFWNVYLKALDGGGGTATQWSEVDWDKALDESARRTPDWKGSVSVPAMEIVSEKMRSSVRAYDVIGMNYMDILDGGDVGREARKNLGTYIRDAIKFAELDKNSKEKEVSMSEAVSQIEDAAKTAPVPAPVVPTL